MLIVLQVIYNNNTVNHRDTASPQYVFLTIKCEILLYNNNFYYNIKLFCQATEYGIFPALQCCPKC